MSCWNKDQLEQMLFDVVNELDLSDSVIKEHGPMGTPPAELVKLVLNQKDKTIRMLKAGMVDASQPDVKADDCDKVCICSEGPASIICSECGGIL